MFSKPLFTMVAMVGVIALCMTAAQSHASVINGVTYIDPTITSFTSQKASPFNLDRPAVSIVNGAGLTFANGQHSTLSDGTGAAGDGHMWMAAFSGAGSGYPQVIVFNLGAIYDLQSMHVWNFNEPGDVNGNYGVKNVNISTSVNNVLYSTPVPYVFTPASGLSTDTGLDYALAVTGVQYVRFSITSNYRINNSNLQLAGLSEVRFQEAAVIPVIPAPAALPAGLALLGVMCIKRRKHRA